MNPVHTLSRKAQSMTELLFWNVLSPVRLFAVVLSLNWGLKVIRNSLGRFTRLPLGSPVVGLPPFSWVINQIDEDDLEGLWRDYSARPKQVYQGQTRDGWWWWWWWRKRCLFAFSSGFSRSGVDERCVDWVLLRIWIFRQDYILILISFLGLSAKLREVTVGFVMSVCPHGTSRLFIKFDIWGFFENMSGKFKLD